MQVEHHRSEFSAMDMLSPWKVKKIYQSNKISKFQQKVNFSLDVGDYTIKTARTPDDLMSALKLRHKIFIQEGLGLGSSGDIDAEIDFDKFDLSADHILLYKRSENKLIGTYRVLSTGYCEDFYSKKGFLLDNFFKSPGLKLELGRACIHRDYRKSIAIHLIWKGLGRYATLVGADKLFGCTSVKVRNKFLAQQILNYLKPEHLSDDYAVTPKSKYKNYETSSSNYEILSREEVKKIIPPLMKSYIRAGAKFYGVPGYDSYMKTTDYFTILRPSNMSDSYKKKYFSL